jgi:type IV pilus assembly protein PilV
MLMQGPIMKYAFINGKQSGVMLLEALIGILIFSIGVLAIVGLQAASVKNQADAKYRSDASYFVNQIIGQMWINRANLASYACNPCTTTNGNADTQVWVTQIHSGGSTSLPGVTNGANQPQIVLGAANNQVTVTVFWKTPQQTAGHNFTAIAYIN